jgi:hypothetical protein
MHLFWCPQCSPTAGLIQCKDPHCLGHHPTGQAFCPRHQGMITTPWLKSHPPPTHKGE